MGVCRTDSGLKVFIKPEKVWDFFMANRDKLKREMCMIAMNESTKYELRLDIEGEYPLLRVFYNGESEYGRYITNRTDAPAIIRGVILTQLCPVVEETEVPDDQDDDVAPSRDDEEFDVVCQAMIDMREDHLYAAAGDFLTALLNTCSSDIYSGEIPEAVIENVCKMLARRFKISVFRPTWKSAENGEAETYEEYPYLDTDKPDTTVGEPLSYEDAMEHLDEQSYCDDDEEQGTERDDFPVT